MARPLLRKKKGGTSYTRPPGIEKEIDEALLLDSVSLLANVRTKAPGDERYPSCECLVHLIRNALRMHDDSAAAPLLQALLQRCEAILCATMSEKIPNASTIRDDILSSLGMMFAQDAKEPNSTVLDYFECRFNSAFRALRINHIREARTTQEPLQPIPDIEDSAGNLMASDDVLSMLKPLLRHELNPDDHVHLRQCLEAVDKLPAELRAAVILCRILGYDEESDNPSKRTAATICGCTGRTIRNRLARADKLLKDLR